MTDPFIGQISMIGFNFPPRGWNFCNGLIINTNENPALYALLGNEFGGHIGQSFALPDLRGRIPLGSADMGNSPTIQGFYPRGTMNGAEEIVLLEHQMPVHTHIATASGDVSSLQASMPAYNDNGNTLNPGPGVVPAIGNYTSGLTTTQIKNYSTNDPNTSLNVYIASSEGISVNVANEMTGSNQSHYNMQPYTAINFVIALEGTFPPRN